MILLVPQKLPIGKIIGHPYQGEIARIYTFSMSQQGG